MSAASAVVGSCRLCRTAGRPSTHDGTTCCYRMCKHCNLPCDTLVLRSRGSRSKHGNNCPKLIEDRKAGPTFRLLEREEQQSQIEVVDPEIIPPQVEHPPVECYGKWIQLEEGWCLVDDNYEQNPELLVEIVEQLREYIPGFQDPPRNDFFSQCVVCMDKPVEYVFIKCGHLSLCEVCAMRIQDSGAQCPICRKCSPVLRVHIG